MKIVVGLGNPGKQYAATPHNVGYETVDLLAADVNASLRKSFRFKSRVGKGTLSGESVVLLKPETYMNRSGVAVQAVMRYYRIALSELIVVLDDADLELGRIRVKARGSSGGHRGLGSVMEQVQSREVVRVRIGIGRRGEHETLVGHVLSPFSRGDREVAAAGIRRAADAVRCVIENGADAAMNAFNAPVEDVSG